jgi:hypothetical protein
MERRTGWRLTNAGWSEIAMLRWTRLLMIVGVTLGTVAIIMTMPPVRQNQGYHNFADQRSLLGIPNFLNVVSNAAFLLVGALGLLFLSRQRDAKSGSPFIERAERWPYATLFLGVALTGLGSTYYHLAPDSARLVWDRLPMTMAFAAILSGVIAERIGVKTGLLSLAALVAVGDGSLVYWHVTELGGRGDLRPYALVQVYPMLVIPLVMLLFPARYTRTADLLAAAALYGLAKGFEASDAQIFAPGHIVSGHTMKHLAAAMGTYLILRMLHKRRPLATKRLSMPGTRAATSQPYS